MQFICPNCFAHPARGGDQAARHANMIVCDTAFDYELPRTPGVPALSCDTCGRRVQLSRPVLSWFVS